MITQITRPVLREVSADIQVALKTVEEKHGINFTYKGARFDENIATLKLEMSLISADGTVQSAERIDFLANATLIGLNPDDLDAEVEVYGVRHTIDGYRIRARKNNIIIKKISGGAKYVVPAATIVAALKRMRAAA